MAEGRVYPSIQDKMKAANTYLRRLESDPARVLAGAGEGLVWPVAADLEVFRY